MLQFLPCWIITQPASQTLIITYSHFSCESKNEKTVYTSTGTNSLSYLPGPPKLFAGDICSIWWYFSNLSVFQFFIHVGQAAMKRGHFFPPSPSYTTGFLYLRVWCAKDSSVSCLQQWRWWAHKRITCSAVSLLSATHLTSNITSLTVSDDKSWFTRTNLAWQEYKINLAGKKYDHSLHFTHLAHNSRQRHLWCDRCMHCLSVPSHSACCIARDCLLAQYTEHYLVLAFLFPSRSENSETVWVKAWEIFAGDHLYLRSLPVTLTLKQMPKVINAFCFPDQAFHTVLT